MSIETYTSKPSPPPKFFEPRGLAIRIWHWTVVAFIFGAFATVALATFVLNTGKNIPVVQQQLQQKGVTVDAPTARAVSHAFNDILWNLHTNIGYCIAILVLSRFLIEIFQPRPEKFVKKMRTAAGIICVSVDQAGEKKHYLAVKWGYIIFYLLITVMALTGLVLAFENITFFRSI